MAHNVWVMLLNTAKLESDRVWCSTRGVRYTLLILLVFRCGADVLMCSSGTVDAM